MKETQTIALAGVFQAATLVRQIATQGKPDSSAFGTSIASVFKLDVDSPTDVFGNLASVQLGLKTLIAQLNDPQRELELTRIVISVLSLRRRLLRRSDMLTTIRTDLIAISRQVEHLGVTHPIVLGRLAEVYTNTLSRLRPRVVVSGNPQYLSNSAQVDQIRATLLAAIRAAVLWHQLGGRQWRLILHRREYAMLARGLLARCTLDGG